MPCVYYDDYDDDCQFYYDYYYDPPLFPPIHPYWLETCLSLYTTPPLDNLCTMVCMYPCGHCHTPIPRALAMRQAGYCDSCEWMLTWEVIDRLGVNRETVIRMTARGELLQAGKNIPRPLWHRSTVEHKRHLMVINRQGWAWLVSSGDE